MRGGVREVGCGDGIGEVAGAGRFPGGVVVDVDGAGVGESGEQYRVGVVVEAGCVSGRAGAVYGDGEVAVDGGVQGDGPGVGVAGDADRDRFLGGE